MSKIEQGVQDFLKGWKASSSHLCYVCTSSHVVALTNNHVLKGLDCDENGLELEEIDVDLELAMRQQTLGRECSVGDELPILPWMRLN